jgi:hypothetical protein
MTAPARTPSQTGRSNRTRGYQWMKDVAFFLRGHGFPGADPISSNGRSDIAGLTEWAIECKNMQTDRWPDTMRQVQRDQAARGARWHAVLKKSYGKPAAEGLAVMTIAQWAEIAAILDHIGGDL